MTGNGPFHRVTQVMRLRLTSVVIVLMLSGSSIAGVPMQFGEHSCPMDHAAGDMPCCKAALMGGQNTKASAARLCCTLNCSKEGTSPSNSVRFSPQLNLSVIRYPPLPQLLTLEPRSRRFDPSHGPPLDSNPAYIRHLSLLI